MSWSLRSPLVIVAAALALVGLERLRPYDRGQKLFRPGFWTDLLLYTFVQSYVLALAIGAVIRGLDRWTGASRAGLLAGWPVGAQVALFVVTHDLYIYAFHRW